MKIPGDTITLALARLAAHENLEAAAVEEVVGAIMSGQASAAQSGAFLMGLRMKGESEDEIAGAALGLRRHMTPVPTGDLRCVDTCGTGGDGLSTFNISTAAALVVAGAGQPVAKHGNRSVSSRCGSADVMEALGVPLLHAPGDIIRCLQAHGLAFLYAPHLHPAMRHAAPIRREIGVRTVFNLAGPLANPAQVACQVMGVPDVSMQPLMARVLKRLGVEAAWVVTGEDGMDELTTTGKNHITILERGEVRRLTLDARDVGLSRASPHDLAGGDAMGNARRIEAVLAGEGGAARDIVLLNAAAALTVSGKSADLAAALSLAERAIDSQAAAGVLEGLRSMGAPVRP